MKRLINNIISVIYTFIKFNFIKIFKYNQIYFDKIERFSPLTQVDIGKNSKLIIGSKVRAHSGTKLRVRKDGTLKIGANTSFNYNCIVTCHSHIEIGEGVEFGPSVYIYDHDHDFRVDGGIKSKKYRYGEVKIGKNVWIGANSVILKDTVIGDNSVIGAGSIIKGSYPENSVIIQKRETIVKSYKHD